MITIITGNHEQGATLLLVGLSMGDIEAAARNGVAFDMTELMNTSDPSGELLARYGDLKVRDMAVALFTAASDQDNGDRLMRLVGGDADAIRAAGDLVAVAQEHGLARGHGRGITIDGRGHLKGDQ